MTSSGPRVVVLYEDKTGGGLHNLVRLMVELRRADEGRAPISHFKPLAMKGNTQLISECSNYQRIRRYHPHKACHVVAVIDAYNVENAAGLASPAWERGDPASYREQCVKFDRAIRAVLYNRAFGGMSETEQSEERNHFHPIVLFWERESIFLAGGEILKKSKNLDFQAELLTASGVMDTHCPTRIVEEAWRVRFKAAYKKQVDGPRLFGDISNNIDRWPTVLERMPSLREIVDTISNF
jgi:hypothetical protein